jgi:hypothetical protein
MDGDSFVTRLELGEIAALFRIEVAIPGLFDLANVVPGSDPLARSQQFAGNGRVVELPKAGHTNVPERVIPVAAINKDDRAIRHLDRFPGNGGPTKKSPGVWALGPDTGGIRPEFP